MTYASAQDMSDRFGDASLILLTDRVNGAAIDTQVLAKALADADAQINSYISTRYTIPVTPTPAALIPVACNLAYYSLYPTGAPEAVKTNRDEAIALLRDVSTGRAGLGLGGPAATTSPSAGIQVATGDRVMTRDNLADLK